MRLDAVMIKHGIITEDQAYLASKYMMVHGGRFGEALVALGVLNEHQVQVFLGEQERHRATSLFAKSRAVLKMMRAAAQSTATRLTEVKP